MSTNNNPHGQLNQAQAQNTSWNPLQLEHQMNPLLPPYVRNSTIFDSMDLSLQSARATTSPLNKGGVMGMPIAPQLDFGIKATSTTANEQSDHTLLQQQSLLTQTQLHSTNNYPIHNLSMNASSQQSLPPSPQQQQQQQMQQQATNMQSMPANTTNVNLVLTPNTSPNMHTNSGKYINANGANDCESSMLPPMSTNAATTTTTTSTTNANNNANSKNNNNNNNNNSNPSSGGPSPVHYMRSDADLVPRLNEHFAKMNEMRRMSFDGEYPPKSVQKSEELVSKECNFNLSQPNKMLQAPQQQQQQQQQLSPKKQSPLQGYQTPQQQQQKTPPQLSPYHNQGNSGKRNGPNTPPNQSPTTPQAQHSLLLQGNVGRPSGGGMDYHQLQGNNFKQQPQQSPIQQQQQQQHFIPPPPHQQHNIYHPQQQQQQNSSPPNSHLLNRNTLPCTLTPSLLPTTDDMKFATPRSRSHSNSSSSSSSSDDDEDDDSVDSSNSSHSHQSRHKFVEKSGSTLANLDISKKDEMDCKVNTSPLPTSSQSSHSSQKPASPHAVANPSSPQAVSKELLKNTATSAQENGLKNKESLETSVSENSNESIRNKNCDFLQQMLDSPKTKKQKQALKIRNAEQANSNSNSSIINETKKEVIKRSSMATNDNAVLADDLRKEQTVHEEMKSTYSSRSNSRSSNTSSSSSICSHSSASSNESKTHKTETQPNTSESNAVINFNENSIKDEKVIKEDKQELKTVKNEDNTETAQKVIEKSSTFEEVENKLEEMFAGIEDEEPQREGVQVPIIDTPAVADLNLALQLAHNSPTLTENETKISICKETKLPVPTLLPMATKASKKSTPPTPTQLYAPTSQFFSQPLNSVAATNEIPPTNGTATSVSKAIDVVEKRNRNGRSVTDTKTENNNISITNVQNSMTSELPSTSASSQLKGMELNTNSEIKETIDKERKQTGKTTKRKGANKSKSKSTTTTTATNNKISATKNNSKQKQQQKSNRRRRNSSDEEDSNSTKDPINSSTATTDVKYRSPFVLVKRDGSVSVINAPTAEEAGSEKLGGKNKKMPAAKYAHERNRIRGLHSSTLSNKYDADTTDSTWICVFCKRGPHKDGLGDLFGPYLISIDCDEYRTALKLPGAIDVDAMFAAKRRRVDMVQTHPRNLPIVPAINLIPQQQPSPSTSSVGRGKKKRKLQPSTSEALLNDTQETLNTSTSSIEYIGTTSDSDIFLGMSKVSENSYEVWIHEDCAVWASDVYLVGSRVTGLDVTVWNSARYNCEICHKPGATVCCLERDCKTTAHAPCAKQAGWSLNETHMKVYCRRHIEQKCKQMGVLSNALFFLNAVQMVNSHMPAAP